MEPPASRLARTPRRYSDALLKLVYFIEEVCRRLGGRRFYSCWFLRRDRLRVVERDVPIASLPGSLDGLRLLHLSDFHAGPFLDATSLNDLVARANELGPDVVLFTGDYITHAIDEGMAIAATLGRIDAPLGAFAVFGNHDYRERREGELVEAFSRVGITSLRNEGRAIERNGGMLWIAGIEDVEEGKVVDLDRALSSDPTGVTVLLAHNPSSVAAAAERGVALVLSGHTHGGQIVVGRRSLLGERSRYRHGLFQLHQTWLHVTSGVGVLMVPFRVGAPPEIALIRLRRKEDSE